MVKQTQKVRCLLPTNFLSLFDHFMGLVLKELVDIFEVELGGNAFLDIGSFLFSIVFLFLYFNKYILHRFKLRRYQFFSEIIFVIKTKFCHF